MTNKPASKPYLPPYRFTDESRSMDYKAILNDIIDEMKADVAIIPLTFRLALIESITDAYIEQTGERPDGTALYRLGDIALYESLEGDTRRNKARADEYPVLSEQQKERRTHGLHVAADSSGLTQREVPLEAAFYRASDGGDYLPPVRKESKGTLL